MTAISGVGIYILPHNFTHWIDWILLALNYVFDYAEVEFTTRKLFQSLFMPFLTENVKNAHKT